MTDTPGEARSAEPPNQPPAKAPRVVFKDRSNQYHILGIINILNPDANIPAHLEFGLNGVGKHAALVSANSRMVLYREMVETEVPQVRGV